MRTRLCLTAASLLPAALLCVPSSPGKDEAPAAPIRWKKTVIDKKFRSEGVAVADVNKDGKMDILLGEVWFEAPDWKMHEIRKPARDYGNGLGGYSESFCCWTDDINGDGWQDLIVIRFPGRVCHWYENPKNKPGHWKEHVLYDNACNETPQYVNLFRNQPRVLVMGIQPKGKGDNNEGQMVWLSPGKDPTQPWEPHPISEPGKPGKPAPGSFRFSHGLGIGDVNGDGRLDVICTAGWWEQPAKVEDKPWKFHPFRYIEKKADDFKFGQDCADMFAVDLDGDGKVDILSSSAHKYGIWADFQRPGGENETVLQRRTLFKDLVSETHALHFVDINGDGLKDMVTGKRWWSHGRGEPGSDKPPMLYWFEAKKGKDGTITFTPHEIDNDSGIGTQFVVTDFNGDGLPDIVTSNKKGTYLFEQVRDKK